MALPVIFVHGWAFDNSLWHSLLPCFPQAITLSWEQENQTLPERFTGVGHSLGVQWLLKHHAPGLAALVSISGTTCYTKKDDFPHGVPAPVLHTMRKAFTGNPQKVLSGFYQACSLPQEHTPDNTGNHHNLSGGLQKLEEWDTRHVLASMNIPVHALHARNDAITPLAAALASFGENNTTILETTSHTLPLTHTAECITFLQQWT